MLKYTKTIVLTVAILLSANASSGHNTIARSANQPDREKQTSDNEKNQHKPFSTNRSEATLILLKRIYPASSEEYNQAYKEYQTLVNDPLFKQVETAKTTDWSTVVSRVISGEIDPNIEVGQQLKKFDSRLAEIQSKMQQERLTEEERLQAERVEQGMKAFTERLPQVPFTLFNELLRSENATLDDIKGCIESGAKINSEQLVSIILSPKGEEAVKLDRIKLLIAKGADAYGDDMVGGDKMTSFEVSMVRGNFAIADYLVSIGVSPVYTHAANTAVLSPPAISNNTLNYLEKFGLEPDVSWYEFKDKYKHLSGVIEKSYR